MNITRRQALGLAVAAAAAPFVANAQQRRPNIVFIMADDLGYGDLSCYGRRDYQTPNIDRLASSGTRFLQAYANSSVCTATRVSPSPPAAINTVFLSAMKSRWPQRGDRGRAIGLPPAHPTLASLLRKAGYQTALDRQVAPGPVAQLRPSQERLRSLLGDSQRRRRLLHPSKQRHQSHVERLVGRRHQYRAHRLPDGSVGRPGCRVPSRASPPHAVRTCSACTSRRRIGPGKAPTTRLNRSASAVCSTTTAAA